MGRPGRRLRAGGPGLTPRRPADLGHERASVVLVDDHELLRDGLRMLLTPFGLAIVGEAGTVDEALDVVVRTQPDLVLLDLRLPDQDGLDVARALRAGGSTVRVLALSAHDRAEDLRAALTAGVDGYLLKTMSAPELARGVLACVAGETVIHHDFVPTLVEDVRHDRAGPPEPTVREREVLGLVAAGHGNREISEELDISLRTAQKHVENLFSKAGVHDRAELVAQAHRRGFL